MIYRTRITILCIAILLSLSLAASADPVTDLKKFENNTAANADEVNANFNNVKKAVDDNYERILNFSEPRSVTYSAMGFSPNKSNINGNEFDIEFEKHDDGYLTTSDNGSFYHNVTLRSGATITQIRAFVYDGDSDGNDSGYIEITLKKLQINNNEPKIVPILPVKQSENIGYQVMRTALEETIMADTAYPPSYFIEVYFSSDSKNLRFYSVTIDYEYPVP